ncbi:Related to collagenase [hydrothermal vent metagenome]|uniref:Related to collagenase n=1 Tax=hydrothermal vent metagenome TaxID=652676 RepID=A0A3B1A1B3_9ZZZZ
MKNDIELLAPGGDIESIKAAILAGANAVYCGLDKFNARSQAKNITINELPGILRLAHNHECEVFLTLNIIIIEREIPALIGLLNKLVNTTLDGIIIQDLGVFYLINKYFPSIKIHASTQMTTHNAGQIKFLSKLNATRVNLSRELTLPEVTALTTVAHACNILTEVFVHGSNCISFSGLCYMSSVTGGNSGNRGQCSQPCRDEYLTTSEGKNFPLNIKDNSAFSDIGVLADAQVDSVKIEGRIKKYHYVHTVVETWRKQLDSFFSKKILEGGNNNLRKVFNRDFSNSFLKGDVSRDVFIDNPRDHSPVYRAKVKFGFNAQSKIDDEKLSIVKKELSEIKEDIIANVQQRIEQLSIDKAPLIIKCSGAAGNPLSVWIKTPERSFNVFSISNLISVDITSSKSTYLDKALLSKRFKSINDTEYYIDSLDLDNLQHGVFIPFKELNIIKNKIITGLNNGKEVVAPVELKRINASNDNKEITPSLSVLISSKEDIYLCDETDADVYFQLPNHFKDKLTTFIELFKNNKGLIPWFPAVLIGENYRAAVEFLQQVQPERIVTNNSGVAYAAYEQGIAWTAGPYMNLVNSYSLLCLKEEFNCVGAFISNEISKSQIKKIHKPDNFDLTYSISHPIVLMTTIACMFHQVSGCKKNIVDDKCIQRCEKSSSITNLKEVSYFIDKEKGGYHTVYNETNFLNTDIVSDIKNVFSNFFVDLRDIKTNTNIDMDKLALMKNFDRYISGNTDSINDLQKSIYPSTNTQYSRGI